MPQTAAPLRGLQAAAASPDELIQQRMGVNQTMAGMGGQAPPAAAQPRPLVAAQQPAISHELTTKVPTDFANLHNTYDPQGMIAALKQSGYTGQRQGDIQLPDEPQSVDELTRRVDALMRGR